MGRYSKKRNVKKFWDDPLANLCFTLSVLAFAAGIFGIFAVIGGTDGLLFTVIALAAGVLLIAAGKKLKKNKTDGNP